MSWRCGLRQDRLSACSAGRGKLGDQGPVPDASVGFHEPGGPRHLLGGRTGPSRQGSIRTGATPGTGRHGPCTWRPGGMPIQASRNRGSLPSADSGGRPAATILPAQAETPSRQRHAQAGPCTSIGSFHAHGPHCLMCASGAALSAGQTGENPRPGVRVDCHTAKPSMTERPRDWRGSFFNATQHLSAA